jgi:hypothetical protein
VSDRLPFEVHRVLEYLLGLGLMSLVLHFGGALTLVSVAGVVVVVLAATTSGRLGVVHWWSWRVHRALDLGVVALAALLPLTPVAGGALVAVFLEPTAVVLLLLTLRTNYQPVERSAAGITTEVPFAEVASRAAPVVDATARHLGRLAGRLEVAAQARRKRVGEQAHVDLGPPAAPPTVTTPPGEEPSQPAGDPLIDVTARRLGRLTGRLMAAAQARRRR